MIKIFNFNHPRPYIIEVEDKKYLFISNGKFVDSNDNINRNEIDENLLAITFYVGKIFCKGNDQTKKRNKRGDKGHG